MRIMVVLAMGMVLTGCASRVSSSMAAWVGHSEAEALSAFGAPDDAYPMEDGGRIMTWQHSRQVAFPTSDGHAVPVSAQCERQLTFDAAGTVTHWRWSGNDCRSISP